MIIKTVRLAAMIGALAPIVLWSGVADASDNKIRIQGKSEQVAIVGTSNNVAIGRGAKAHNSIAAVRGGVTVKGDVKQRVLLGNVNNLALGPRSKAQTNVATVGRNATINGDVKQTAIIGSITTIATPGKTAKTSIATVSDNANINRSVKQFVAIPKVINPGGCVSVGSVGPKAGCK